MSGLLTDAEGMLPQRPTSLLADSILFSLEMTAKSDALAAEMGSNGGVAFEFCDTATDEEQEAEIERKRVERVGS